MCIMVNGGITPTLHSSWTSGIWVKAPYFKNSLTSCRFCLLVYILSYAIFGLTLPLKTLHYVGRFYTVNATKSFTDNKHSR